MGRRRGRRRVAEAEEENLARERAKRTVEKAGEVDQNNDDDDDKNKVQSEKESSEFLDQEVERQIAATRAVRDVEIEKLLTALRLLRSNFNEEQFHTPVLQFFKENFPNLSLLKDQENGQIEVKRDNADDDLLTNHIEGTNVHTSLLHRLSMGYSNYCIRPDLSKTERTRHFGSGDLQFKDVVSQGPSDAQVLGMIDALKTPGANSQRLSIGMTPETRRLPKPGEMLLSVHGSPLGVFKEDDRIIGAINEEVD